MEMKISKTALKRARNRRTPLLGYGCCGDKELEELQRLLRKERIQSEPLPLARSFVMALREAALADWPCFRKEDGNWGASRGNCTFHWATKMREVSRCFNFACRFEATGRYDAIVEAVEIGERVPVLVAEWEWDFEDIFGDGKEVEKLVRAAQEHGSTADCMLISYFPENKFAELTARVITKWRKQGAKRISSLFLVAVVYRGSSTREPKSIRVVEVNQRGTTLWPDLNFSDDTEEE